MAVSSLEMKLGDFKIDVFESLEYIFSPLKTYKHYISLWLLQYGSKQEKYRPDTVVQDSTLVGAAIPTQNADKTGTRPMGSDFGEMSIVDFLSSQLGNLDQICPLLFGIYPNGLFTFGLLPFGLPMTFGLTSFGLFWAKRTCGLSPFGLL